MNLIALGISYEWNHIICILLWLSYFTYHVFKIHPCCGMCQNFLIMVYIMWNNIPLYVYTTFYSSIHTSMDIWIDSAIWLLWIILLWTWVYKYLFGSLLSKPLGINSEVELLNHVVIVFLILGDHHTVFHNNCTILHAYQLGPGFSFLQFLTNTERGQFWWWLIAAEIYFPLHLEGRKGSMRYIICILTSSVVAKAWSNWTVLSKHLTDKLRKLLSKEGRDMDL